MRNFRFFIVALVTIFVVALGVYGLVHKPGQEPGDDVIIIKGGSMSIQCGYNHGKDCLNHTSGTYTYTHKKNAHILHVQVLDSNNTPLLDRDFDGGHQPTIRVTYK